MRVLASAVLLALVDRFGGGAYWQIGPSSWRAWCPACDSRLTDRRTLLVTEHDELALTVEDGVVSIALPVDIACEEGCPLDAVLVALTPAAIREARASEGALSIAARLAAHLEDVETELGHARALLAEVRDHLARPERIP